MSHPHEAAMRRALALGQQAAGTTSPNPPVGCVVLDAAGRPAGEGHTQPVGGPHAEMVALRQAGARAAGGTAVVTLEPCAHTGRTGPCVSALRAAGVTHVYYAVDDPDPVAAGGAAALRAAGLIVERGVLRAEAAAGALRPWLHAIRTGRPFVTWKYAATLDGRVAAADRSSRWISSPQSRADVHALRATVDAIIVGSGTVLADDPHLTVRPDGQTESAHQPLRVVLDRRGRVPPSARVRDAAAPTLVLDAADPAMALKRLHERGVRHALLEGGPTVAGAFVAGQLVDRVIGYLAPTLLGAGPPALGEAGIASLGAALRLCLDEVARVGPDIRITASPASSDAKE